MKSSVWINTSTPHHGGNMMNAWRNAYAMHDTNAFYKHKSPKDRLFLLTNIWASWFIFNHHHSAPCMHLRRWHGPSDFPWQNDEAMQQMIDDTIQIYMCESTRLIAQNRNRGSLEPHSQSLCKKLLKLFFSSHFFITFMQSPYAWFQFFFICWSLRLQDPNLCSLSILWKLHLR